MSIYHRNNISKYSSKCDVKKALAPYQQWRKSENIHMWARKKIVNGIKTLSSLSLFLCLQYQSLEIQLFWWQDEILKRRKTVTYQNWTKRMLNRSIPSNEVGTFQLNQLNPMCFLCWILWRFWRINQLSTKHSIKQRVKEWHWALFVKPVFLWNQILKLTKEDTTGKKS